ncbi:MAG: undecaprenyl/decaprenyl-phosphate alpha-N-acetylglucosaminyl 1-phosphate transferase [Phycisphaerales bacterium]|nr:undecaprenyl/decaprenyl-phosphate alpha-N-acetylglucosaminyl 1-phosphate transferase [Phycisphaerales bacterium]
MVWLCLMLVGVSFLVSLPATRGMVWLGHHLRALDSEGVAGQIKAPRRMIPNTGGVAIFAGVVLPLLAGVLAVWAVPQETLARLAPSLGPHLPGIRQETPRALLLAGCLAGLHALGLIDDRRALGPWVKLIIMIIPALAAATFGGTRLLTMLDAHVGGAWLSVLVTVLWFLVVTNAMNFMDNMDGLSGGVAAIAAGCLLASALASAQPQWFVGACLALLAGSLLGFLVFNFPPAKIFMGDGGSLVIGFLLAFLSIRLTYVPAEASELPAPQPVSHWYAVLTPLVVLAIPLYDFVSVVVIRLSQGRSPFVGDLQHFSHRLVKKGLSKRAAVLVIYGFTLCTGVSGISLGTLRPWQAALVGLQTLTLLGVLAVFEWRSTRGAIAAAEARP